LYTSRDLMLVFDSYNLSNYILVISRTTFL
jgi:hypothetical protein